jgi:PAS domain-containing protein
MLQKSFSGFLTGEFKDLLSQIEGAAFQQGIHLRPSPETVFLRFQKHTKATQLKILGSLLNYYEIFAQALKDKAQLRDGKTMLWYALKRFGLRPTSEVFDVISDEDIIEIYNADGIQIYRNLNFYEISSYSLGELVAFEWSELYQREDQVSVEIMKLAGDILKGKYSKTFQSPIPRHKLIEKFSEECHVLDMIQRHYSPLYPLEGGRQVVGVIATSQVHVLEKTNSKRSTFSSRVEVNPEASQNSLS